MYLPLVWSGRSKTERMSDILCEAEQLTEAGEDRGDTRSPVLPEVTPRVV